MIEIQEARKIAAMLAAVGETTRMLILHRLVRGPQYVGQLSEALDVPMVNMSHHLGVMRNAGLVDNTKDGRRVVYAFRPEVFSPGDGKDTLGTLRLGSFRLILMGSAGEADDNGKRTAKKSAKKK